MVNIYKLTLCLLFELLRCCITFLSTLFRFADQNLYWKLISLPSSFDHLKIEPQIVFWFTSYTKLLSFSINLTFGNKFYWIIVFNTNFKPYWPCINALKRSTNASYINLDNIDGIVTELRVSLEPVICISVWVYCLWINISCINLLLYLERLHHYFFLLCLHLHYLNHQLFY